MKFANQNSLAKKVASSTNFANIADGAAGADQAPPWVRSNALLTPRTVASEDVHDARSGTRNRSGAAEPALKSGQRNWSIDAAEAHSQLTLLIWYMLSTCRWTRKGPIGIKNDVEIGQHHIAQEAFENVLKKQKAYLY